MWQPETICDNPDSLIREMRFSFYVNACDTPKVEDNSMIAVAPFFAALIAKQKSISYSNDRP